MTKDKLHYEARYWAKWAIKNGRTAWEQQKSRLIDIRGREKVLELVDRMREVKDEVLKEIKDEQRNNK